jgi:hypothetical protein
LTGRRGCLDCRCRVALSDANHASPARTSHRTHPVRHHLETLSPTYIPPSPSIPPAPHLHVHVHTCMPTYSTTHTHRQTPTFHLSALHRTASYTVLLDRTNSIYLIQSSRPSLPRFLCVNDWRLAGMPSPTPAAAVDANPPGSSLLSGWRVDYLQIDRTSVA